MTLGAWLDSRRPLPPPALAERVRSLLAADASAPASQIPDRCLAAAEGLLVTLVDSAGTTRNAALDLLAADALVTYAFEAASEEPDGVEERARLAMHRIAALVDGAAST